MSICALSMCLADCNAGMQGNGEVALHWVALSAAPAILAVAPASMLLSLHLLQKSATSGTLLAQYGSDIVAAVVMGLVVMGCCGYVLHMLAMSRRASLKVRNAAFPASSTQSLVQAIVGHLNGPMFACKREPDAPVAVQGCHFGCLYCAGHHHWVAAVLSMSGRGAVSNNKAVHPAKSQEGVFAPHTLPCGGNWRPRSEPQHLGCRGHRLWVGPTGPA